MEHVAACNAAPLANALNLEHLAGLLGSGPSD
jgi:hypothetical protein